MLRVVIAFSRAPWNDLLFPPRGQGPPPHLRVWGTLFQVHGRWHFSGTLQGPAQLSLISGAQGPFPRLGRNADSQTQLQFCKQPSPPEGPKLKAPCDTKHVLYWHQILVFQLFLFVSHLAVILPPAERSAWKGSRPSAPVHQLLELRCGAWGWGWEAAVITAG